MSRTKLSSLFLALAFLSGTARLLAFDDWQPINPEELKMTADAAHPGDAIILYHEETADDLANHRLVYLRLKILTEKGKDRANVEIPYDATEGGITDIKARTIAPDGTITPFTGKAFNSTIVKAHGVKYQAKTFTLSNVQVGSIIEWKYTEYWADELLHAPHWVVQEDLVQKRAKFAFVPFLKPGYSIHDERGEILDRVFYTLIGLPENTSIKETPNLHMELELKDIPAFQEEDFAPPSAVLKWRVNFYYGDDKMAQPEKYWKNEGKYWTKEVDKFAVHSPAVTAAVNDVISPSDTPEQKARKIYAFVQKIKNLNYVNREGGLEEMLTHESKEKRNADTVLSNHEGYRYEIARLFLAMARTANLPAYLMHVADRDEVFFRPGIPNRGQLTSEIAIVTIDGKDVFLDPGTPLCPFGLLSWQHNATQGIRQTPEGGTALAPTPGASYKDALSKHVGWLTLSEDGSAKGKIGVAWAGEEALVRRISGLKTDAAGRKKDLEDELTALLPNGSSVHLDTASGWDDSEAQLTANFTVEIPSYASSAGKRLLVPPDLFRTRTRQPFSQGERKNPVYFNYPFYAADETHITYPEGFHVESIPDTQPVQTGFSLYTVRHTASGNTIVFSRDFGMAALGFQQKDYPDLRKFYSAVATGDSQPLLLTSAK
ncbi:MAG TPA: DUF3857 domain-containing protein [Candidatus Angelobacter sp.]|nr:DUF3857 domain-containing protein [Candidatus Angelobacter sp.]